MQLLIIYLCFFNEKSIKCSCVLRHFSVNVVGHTLSLSGHQRVPQLTQLQGDALTADPKDEHNQLITFLNFRSRMLIVSYISSFQFQAQFKLRLLISISSLRWYSFFMRIVMLQLHFDSTLYSMSFGVLGHLLLYVVGHTFIYIITFRNCGDFRNTTYVAVRLTGRTCLSLRRSGQVSRRLRTRRLRTRSRRSQRSRRAIGSQMVSTASC